MKDYTEQLDSIENAVFALRAETRVIDVTDFVAEVSALQCDRTAQDAINEQWKRTATILADEGRSQLDALMASLDESGVFPATFRLEVQRGIGNCRGALVFYRGVRPNAATLAGISPFLKIECHVQEEPTFKNLYKTIENVTRWWVICWGGYSERFSSLESAFSGARTRILTTIATER